MKRNKPRKLARQLYGDYWIDQPRTTAVIGRVSIMLTASFLYSYCIFLFV